MKVLVLDDDAACRRAVEVGLGEWGYEAVAVSDGRSAWEQMQVADYPRLAVVNWMMPGFSGLDFCRRVRAEKAASDVHIVMLSGRDRDEDVIEGLNAGADDYITKPFDVKKLKGCLARGALRVLSRGCCPGDDICGFGSSGTQVGAASLLGKMRVVGMLWDTVEPMLEELSGHKNEKIEFVLERMRVHIQEVTRGLEGLQSGGDASSFYIGRPAGDVEIYDVEKAVRLVLEFCREMLEQTGVGAGTKEGVRALRLRLVEELVEKMGGRMEVADMKDGLAGFRVFLPVFKGKI